jgi:hypothetical protein
MERGMTKFLAFTSLFAIAVAGALLPPAFAGITSKNYSVQASLAAAEVRLAAETTISPDCRYVCQDSECKVMVMRCTPVKRATPAQKSMGLKNGGGGSAGPTKSPVQPHTGAKQ